MIGIVILFALLVAAGLFFVLEPILGRGSRSDARPEQARNDLLREKQTALRLLRELDFDGRTGKILAADSEAHRAEAEARALEALKRLDALPAPEAPGDEELEAEILRVRLRLRAEAGRGGG